MTQSLYINAYSLEKRVVEHYLHKDPNLTHIYTAILREAASMDLYILDVMITNKHKFSIIQPELMEFDELIALIDEEIELCKLLGIKDG